MRRAVPALLLAAACLRPPAREAPAAAGSAPPSARYRVEDAPRELQPALARAEAAMRTLRERLAARLAAELAAGGVVRSLAVCRKEAAATAAAVSAQTGVEVGRVPARGASGTPPPRPWIAAALEPVAARRAADVPAIVVDLGDRVGLLRPIPLAAPCLACHGAADRVLPEVKLAADGGPVTYAEGDLRGFFWAEAPREKR
jgi:hypothetical protein